LLSANNIRQWRIFRRCGDAQVNAEARCQINERVANVVAVADVGELESAQSAEFFLEREKSASAWQGMKLVGKRLITGMLAFAAISSSTRWCETRATMP